ncbi:hypothetical protein FRB99_007705 [Tulasnella sp. 403]|nr:hypothetical protein FRB99_007705 [Tulasnella sp. 403]
MPDTIPSRARQINGFDSSTRSTRSRLSGSMTTVRTSNTATVAARAVEELIMNMIITGGPSDGGPAWFAELPPSRAPVIIPGMLISCQKLKPGACQRSSQDNKGSNASLKASVAIGLQASNLEAPNAR